MAIIKDVTVKINNGTATLDAPVQFYEKDHDVELRFKLMDYKYKYDKDPQNILNSVDEDVLEAYTTIVNPRGYELEQINGVIKNDTVIFRLDPTYTDELDELGTYKLQIHIKCTHSEFTIPPITFEVLQRLKGIKVVTDGEDEVDNSEILDNSSKFVSDETGKLIIEWKKGDMISSAKLNAMVDVINDAVDEEVIRQANEKERERKAANKIQELENTRVEYVNKFDTELDSFNDQVDESMLNYETRFNALTVSQQQDAEVIDARDGEQTLRARLERDIQKPSIIYEEVEGSHINADTTCGYLKDIEILGNTIQNQNDLADIRSVGDKVENQELYEIPVLSTGKNLLSEDYRDANNTEVSTYRGYKLKLDSTKTYVGSLKLKTSSTPIGALMISPLINPNTVASALPNKNFKYFFLSSGKINETITITHENMQDDGTCYLTLYPDKADSSVVEYNDFMEQYIEYIQIEEGTQATEYEPYQEDKLTILSPVQLEKVGDVADRIICKDGVWGVEKNIGTTVFDGSEAWSMPSINQTGDTRCFAFTFNDSAKGVINSIDKISDKFPSIIHTSENFNTDTEFISGVSSTSSTIAIRILNSKLKNDTPDGFKTWLKENNVTVKYHLAEPTFIPLPYDQQIKLRTFANKTNIHFECEIEPTLKASVPKSLGASVSSNTTQIDNLSKELQKINNLEETTTSEVISESNFTTVENTNNGYFDDVKLEGKTLVNLCGDFVGKNSNAIDIKDNIVTFNEISDARFITYDASLLKPNTTYTLIMLGINIQTKINCDLFPDNFSELGEVRADYPINVRKFTTPDDISSLKHIRYYVGNGVTAPSTLYSPIILEGDHTQNPPEFFEGLKSVGQDVEQISVLSCNKNLFDGELVIGNINDVTGEEIESRQRARSNFINIKNITNLVVSCLYEDQSLEKFLFYDKDKNYIGYSKNVTTNVPQNAEFVRFTLFTTTDKTETMTQLEVGIVSTQYVKHEQNKKRILYYNDETQTWEKPILREWDSIEKHSDGKYYYHKRSGEVVLNGSQHIGKINNSPESNYLRFYSGDTYPLGITNTLPISNLFEPGNTGGTTSEYVGIDGNGKVVISILQSKLSTLDIAGFKAWLQANPTTVVYQLAEEKVYECTDLDLITYANETNLQVKSGVLNPKVTLKVKKGIGNVVTMLQNKVTMLEQMVYDLMKMFNNQQSNIDE